MNMLTRWDPLKEMDELHRRLNTLLSLSPRRGGDEKETMTVAEWMPTVDIIEDDKEYVIKADLPEVNREDVKVRVESGVLVISGERKFEKEDKGRRYHRIERAYGSFARSFTVPEDADASKVSAEFKNGTLLVHLAKAENARPKTIEVKVL